MKKVISLLIGFILAILLSNRAWPQPPPSVPSQGGTNPFAEAIFGQPQLFRLPFAPFMDGIADDGLKWKSVLVLLNTAFIGFSAKIEVNFFDAGGNPTAISINDSLLSTHSFSSPGLGLVRIQTDGKSSPLRTGWIEVRSNRPLTGQLILQVFNQSDRLISEANALSDPLSFPSLGFHAIPLEEKDSLTISILNFRDVGFFTVREGFTEPLLPPISVETSAEANLVFLLVSESGRAMQAIDLPLKPKNLMIRTISELFPDISNFRGYLVIIDASETPFGPVLVSPEIASPCGIFISPPFFGTPNTTIVTVLRMKSGVDGMIINSVPSFRFSQIPLPLVGIW